MATGLIVLGCGLLIVGVIQAVADRRVQGSVGETAVPNVQVRARFSGATPGGQTTGFAVAPDGSLAYVDRGRQRVVRLDANGALLTEWGPRFDSEGDAQDLNGIASAGSDWYLLDRGRPRILQLDNSGRATRSIDLQSLGTYGPNGLAVDARGNIYLADTGGNRILVFSPGGAVIRSIGTPGAGLGQLKQPMALSFGPDGAMYVTDFENNRLERWDASFQATNAWPLTGHSWGVAVDRLSRVFVPDSDRDVVRMYSARGDLLAEIGGRPDSSLVVHSPTQVGLTPDGSALWVLGSDGLARVDLSVYSAIVPSAEVQASAVPFAGLGALLIAMGLAPLAFRASGSMFRAGEGCVKADTHPSPLDKASPRGRGGRPRELAVGMALFAVGGAGVLFTQASLVGPTGKNDPWPRLALLVVSGVVWAGGCLISARALPLAWVAEWPVRVGAGGRLGLSARQALLGGAAVVLGVVAGGVWWVGRFETADGTRAMLVWLIALALAGLACRGDASGWTPRTSVATLISVLLFVLALVPRLWQAADLPYGLWYDEAQGALEVRRVFHQGTYTPILNTYGKDTSGFFYLISALSLILGDNILAARSAAALVGALTVPVTYLLGRELFGWRVGLAAGLLLAFSRWHLNFSRLGFNPISLPLCATLAFWLLARAVRRKQWTDLALAGLALGVGLHAYTGFRGMPIVALAALAAAALLHRWPLASVMPRFGLYLGATALTALPVLIFAVQDPVTFNGRTAQTLILTQDVSDAEKLGRIWDTVQRHALMFNVSGDLNGRHNLPGVPMLDPLTGALMVLGLGWLLLRPLDWRTVMLLGWSAVSMSGGILTLAFEAPQGVRTFGVTPVLAVLGGIGLVASLDRLLAVVTLSRRVRARRAAIATAGLGALAVGWIGWTNFDIYFNHQMRDPDVFASFSTRETVPAKAALEGGGRYSSILASTTMTPSVVGAFLVPDLQATIRQFDPGGDLPYRGQGPGLVFLETEHDQALADEVAHMYPDAVRRPVRAPGGGKAIVEGFQLDPDVLSAHRGIQASYRSADGATVERTEPRPDTATNTAPVALPADVSWRSGLALDATGEYSFRVPAGFELRIDGAVLPSAASSGVRVRLVRGNHAVQVSGKIEAAAPAGLEWRTPGSSRWQLVSTDAFFAAEPGGLGLQLTLTPGLDSGRQQPPRPADEYIDPVLSHFYHVSPFARLHLDPRVWIAEWVGELDAAIEGAYGFSLDHSQTVAVFIDTRQVLGNLDATSDVRHAIVNLDAGRHALRVRFEKTSEGSPWINLHWTPPDAPPSVVPSSALYPPPPVVLGPAQ
jgi:DNA-binding beta-propeller fold protein YncE